MPDFITVNVQGLAQLDTQLREFNQKVAVRALRKAALAGITVLGEEVQQRTPVDTGLLKASVGISVSVGKKEGGVVGVVGFGRQGFVARMVEFGHLVRGKNDRLPSGKKVRNSGKVLGHVPAHPFMRPAFDAKKQEAVDRFVDVMQSEVKSL